MNHVTARVGDNVEIKCDVRGTPPPPIVWRRNDMDLSVLNDQEIKVRYFITLNIDYVTRQFGKQIRFFFISIAYLLVFCEFL